ncbi:hypothetical protein G9F72_004405 [Clostridium estertheticum]|uniref:ornithine carbamoyltransferase n=1 Tax=Clostridium estertheticum TaxID=238834 RepID=UPI0013E962F5|nr:hypothetical protein [Clostridium estertheticum]MBZ9685593.1 hypothetical protein [Clostridium estertheticum]
MKNITSINKLSRDEIIDLIDFTDELKIKNKNGIEYKPLSGKTIITSFPPTSLITKLSFETGIFQLGAQAINFPLNFEGKYLLEDIVGYLNCWIDCLVIRHPEQKVIERITELAEFPVINAMSKKFHPCEILGDLHRIRELRKDLSSLKFVFIGEGANISNTWFEVAGRLDLNITQICPVGYEVSRDIFDFAAENSKGTVEVTNDIEMGIKNADIILTDGWPSGEEVQEKFMPYQINLEVLKLANKNCIVNPCPPFTRGNEVTEEVINSEHFIGYKIKENLFHMQKAILVKTMR